MVAAAFGSRRGWDTAGDNMKALVFGQSGQVARALIAAGAQDGTEIVALSRAQADLAQPEVCAAAIAATDADVVINAAAWTAVDAAEENEAAAHVINADAPGAMARVCTKRAIPFIQISTDYVFDGSEGTAWMPEDQTNPLGAYGRTKLAGEQAVIAAGGSYAILRTAWVFDGEGKNFLTTMLRLSETRDALNVVSDQIGGPTPAAAIADACLTMAKALMANETLRGTYHFSGVPDVSWADFARAIFVAAGRDVAVTDIPSSDYPTPAKRPANSRLNCSDLEKAFGIKRPAWQEAIAGILSAE